MSHQCSCLGKNHPNSSRKCHLFLTHPAKKKIPTEVKFKNIHSTVCLEAQKLLCHPGLARMEQHCQRVEFAAAAPEFGVFPDRGFCLVLPSVDGALAGQPS